MNTLKSPVSFDRLLALGQSFNSTTAITLAILSTAALQGADPSTDTAAIDNSEVDAPTEQADTTEASSAPEPTAIVEDEEESIYDKIWSFTELYKNDENQVIQSLVLSGRFQLDYARIDADQGTLAEWNIRRLRLGAKLNLLREFVLHGEVDLNPQEGDTYQRITDAYAAWVPSQAFELTVGKHSAPFTMDGQTSSKRLLTIDRNNLANNLWFTEEYVPGVSVAGEASSWVYHAGAYSSGIKDGEFGNVAGGVFGLGTVGYNFNDAMEVQEALLRVNYVYNAPEGGGSSFANRPLQQIASLNFSLEEEKWGLRTDISGAQGYDTASDVWGAMVMPWYNISKHLQVVTRYTFVRSIDPNGVRLARYESGVVGSRGNEYHEWYLGLNWYLYGHKLKLQTGVDYADLADRADDGGAYRGWGWTTGLRVSW